MRSGVVDGARRPAPTGERKQPALPQSAAVLSRMVMRYRSAVRTTKLGDVHIERVECRVVRAALFAAAMVATGCAGAFGGYGPGLNGEDRISQGCASDGPGTATATCTTRGYNSGKRSFGAQIGARAGVVSGSAGTIGSGTGLGIDAHADFTMAMARWGVGLQFAYSNDHIFGDNALFYSGVPIVAYGQFALTRRIFVHAGGGRVVHGSIRHNDMSVDASAWRAVAGISFVFARSATRDLTLRFEGRAQATGDFQLEGMNTSYSSTGLLAEIVWASF